ncbi:MAG: valine--tRNA ligase [Spirochaetaceae bacterium]|jgi:valyl-tRNA synthetase|nr:valine--tRNA ligase [Spirochaetaceae bacterium]
MKAILLEKAYDPKHFEERIYALWKDADAFAPSETGGERFVIVIPPPNVTGVLHLGHGLNISLQDIVIRYQRMTGKRVLWLPGTDHAGIATQHVVEKRLRARGMSRRSMTREQFVEETWKVKAEHHAVISTQIARLGASVDWSRERFTLDEGLSRAVREVFVTLFERDLIYRGNYLVNWCTSCGTALSDDEVEHSDEAGKMYHIRYPLRDGGGFVEIATTRPETLLGDTAVAVHPADSRYTDLIGKEVELPLAGRTIPVIADSFVDRAFGTGVVKITPAHDPNDWEAGKRHHLPSINILLPDGRLNDAVPEKYRFLSVQEARKAVLADLAAGGYFIREENITHAVGHCYRCGTVIEPFLSEQWFVRMKPLAEKALAAWRRGEINFIPKRWENTYEHWLENIRDWCISRQLWWGHRIPAWNCADCGKTIVSRTDLAACPICGSTHIEQDPDVLDTWFSSWLWPFSTLGWESADSKTADLERFYPTTALVTAYDIIFFWVARMIMAGLELTGQVPFRDIFITGLVRDKQGRKMSKSLGNGLDPLELVDEFGSDALKFTLAFMCAQGQDILMDRESVKMGSRFANKVWNAARYILMNLEGRALAPSPALLPVDRWIRSRLGNAAKAARTAFDSYRYNDAAQAVYEFFWNDFCDWYVEATKLSLKEGEPAEKDRAAAVLLETLEASLRLLHPLLPFVTEEIYGKLPAAVRRADLLIRAPYPEYRAETDDRNAEANFDFVRDLVRVIRTLRSECTVPPDRKIKALVRVSAPEKEAVLCEHIPLIKLLAGAGELETVSGDTAARPEGSIGSAGRDFEVFVFIGLAVDLAALREKFRKDIEKDRAFIASLRAKLENENFVKNAPRELVAEERAKLEETVLRTEKRSVWLRDLG